MPPPPSTAGTGEPIAGREGSDGAASDRHRQVVRPPQAAAAGGSSTRRARATGRAIEAQAPHRTGSARLLVGAVILSSLCTYASDTAALLPCSTVPKSAFGDTRDAHSGPARYQRSIVRGWRPASACTSTVISAP